LNWANSITLPSSRPGSRADSPAGLRPALAKFHYAIHVADPSRLQTWSQTWLLTCRRQAPAFSTCRDSLKLVADRFRPYSTMLFCSLGRRPVRDEIPSRCPACDQLANWSATC